MSKKISALLVLLALSLAGTSIPVVNSAAIPQRKGAGVAASSAKNAAIVATTTAVLKETSEIRELPILHPVKSGTQSRTEIEGTVIRNLDEQTSPAETHATELALKKLGMVPPEFQYRSFLIKLLTEQVAGYFDAKQQHFFIADWIDLESQKPVMAHELTHALQDQHFDLRRFERWPKGDSDGELAAHALIEGDATLAMKVYMARNPLVALAFMRSFGSSSMPSEQYKLAPRSLRESLVFPYEEGLEWATTVYKKGGWAAVSRAFSELPQSSEQILHPEKYFAKEAPVKVALPDLRAELGSKWKRIDYDVNGEWSYYLILDQFLNSEAESRRAAAGWAGDRYEVYEGMEPGEIFMTQMSVWDTENDAREFFDAYVKRTRLRYANAQAKEVESSSPSRRQWTTNEGGVVIELVGKRALVVEGIPNTVNDRDVTRALWR
ncbi:MAG: hypothetical protein M3R68_11540 [Acidobacteriota bacterium]|nr:hypothetical protein [Acidobacteriota bacterium]